MKLLKILLLLSAGITVVLRLFTYNNADFIDPADAQLLNIVSIAAAAVCLICAVIWIIIIKKEEKRGKEK